MKYIISNAWLLNPFQKTIIKKHNVLPPDTRYAIEIKLSFEYWIYNYGKNRTCRCKRTGVKTPIIGKVFLLRFETAKWDSGISRYLWVVTRLFL